MATSPATRRLISSLFTLALLLAVSATSPVRAQAFDAGLLPKDIFLGAIDNAGDVDVLVFEALRDTKLTLSLAAQKPGTLRAGLRLINLADDSVVAQAAATKAKLKLVVFAPGTGAYRIEVSSSDGTTGPYKVGYKEKLAKDVSKVKIDADVAGGDDFDVLFDALQGFQLSGKLQRFPKKSPATPGEPSLLRPQGGGPFVLDATTLKTNKKGDRYTIKKAGLDASGSWTLRSENVGTQGGLRAALRVKRLKQKKRVIEETASPTTLLAPLLDALPGMTAASSLSVSGSDVMPFGKVQVQGGSMPVQVTANADGEFNASVPLKLNAVQVLFVSQLLDDEQGLTATHEVVQDSTAPTVIIDFPLSGAVLGSSTTNVSGRVGDLLSGFSGLVVTVNGVSANVNVGVGTNGSFDLAGVALNASGSTLLEAMATDALGNTGTTSIQVSFKAAAGAKLALTGGDNQMASVQSVLGTPLQVSLTNASAAPLVGRPVSFRVIKSDGLLSVGTDSESQLMTMLTDAQGLATVDWQLGSDAGMGNNRVEVTASGVPGALYFNASALGATADQIAVGTGNDQSAQAGAALPQALSVWVSDGLNAAPGVSVTFDVTEGGGGLQALGSNATPVAQLVATTDLTGHAAVRWVLGGLPGSNAVTANFAGNPASAVQFRAEGLGQQFTKTRFTGLVLDNSQRPLGGALCELHYSDDSVVSTNTGSDGRFEFTDLPQGGQAQLAVHGDVATTLAGDPINGATLTFPELHYETFLVEGAANSLPRPVLLPPLDPTAIQMFDGTEDIELSLAEMEGLRFLLDATSEVRHADGTLVSPSNPIGLSLSPVHVSDIPMPFADGAAPPFAWTLQPGGTTFDPPLRLEAPNIPGLPAGAVAYFISFNHDTMRFEIVSNATVSADATSITSDPGQGIATAGWGGFCPPYPNQGDLCPSDDIDCLLPPELQLITDDADDEEEDLVDPTTGSAVSTAQGTQSAPGSSAFDFIEAFAVDGTISCQGSTQQCAIDLQAELAAGFSATAFDSWSLMPEATTYKMLMTTLHGSFTELRGLQASAHALNIGISWPIALADTALTDFLNAINAFDPAALESARQQVQDDHDALVLLLAQLASGNEGASLQDLQDLFTLTQADATALRSLLDEFDELALHVDKLDDLLLLNGAMVRSGFDGGFASSMGGYLVPNVTETPAPRRVEVILQAGDITLYGRSAFVAVIAQQGVNSGPITLSSTPLVELVSMQAELMGGVNIIDMLETPVAVSTMADFSDGSSSSLVGFNDGLGYSSSNSIVLSVDANGMATAHQAGLALLSVTREGSVTSFIVAVTPGIPTTTVSGMVVDTSMTPVVGADVSTNEGGAGTSVANGLFDIAGQLATSATLDVTADMGGLMGFTLGVPVVPGGSSLAGLIVLDVDTDSDGLPDWYETNLYATNPALADSDGDGLDDGLEVLQLGTDPTLADSDGDGFDDGAENTLGSDPNLFDSPTTIVGSLMLDGGGVPNNAVAHIAGAPPTLYEAVADGGGDFAFAPYPASLSPVTVLATAPGGFVGTSSATPAVPDGTTDVGEIPMELQLDPLFLGRKFELSDFPREIAYGDINSDGRVDLAVTLGFSVGVEFLLGQPGGTYELGGQVTVLNPQSLVLKDFDGDTLLDLATTAGSGDVHVHLGNGDGTFTFQAMYSVGSVPQDVLAFDSNSDTFLDLHVMSANGLFTLLGNGDGSFAAATSVALGNSPRSMDAGLVNGDAFMDLVVSHVGTQDFMVLLGDGGGTFLPLTQPFLGGPAEVALGFYDNDAVLDVAFGSPFNGLTKIYSGNGDGSFVEVFTVDAIFRAVDLVSADLNGDGDVDLIQATQDAHDMRVLHGNGDGTFNAPVNYETGRGPQALVVTDLDADGILDAAVANLSTEDVSILHGLGDGTFDVASKYDGGASTIWGALADLNGDMALDLLVANGAGDHSYTLLGDGMGDFATPFFVDLPSTSALLTLGHLNGDNVLDMISFEPNTNSVHSRLGLGDGDFAPNVVVHTGNFLAGAALGHFDAGNDLDLLVVNRSASNFSVLLGDGDGTFTFKEDVTSGTSPTVVRVGDLDGNGTLDAVVTDVFERELDIFLNDGSANFTPAPTPSISLVNDARDLILADLDGDGALDILASAEFGDELYVILGNGDGSFAPLVAEPIDSPDSPVVGDFNGDGALDVALFNVNSIEVTVLLGDGDGGFLERQVFHAGEKPSRLLVGLINDDALLDLVALNHSGRLSLVLLHQ